MYYYTKNALCPGHSFAGGICARRRRKNFSPYVALQAWAGTPGVQLGEDSDRGLESSETGRRTGLLSCRNGQFIRECRGVGRTVETPNRETA